MTPQQNNQLNNLMGQTIQYNNKEITLIRFVENREKITITTSGRLLCFLLSELDSFFDNLKIVESKKQFLPKHQDNKPANILQYSKSTIHVKLEEALSDMIDKVRDDKEYIQQANAICNITSSVVSLEKQQFNLLKATGKL